MNLRLKTLLASSLATVALIAGLSVGLSFLILRQISDTEKLTLTHRLDETLRNLQDNVGVRAGSPDPSGPGSPRGPGGPNGPQGPGGPDGMAPPGGPNGPGPNGDQEGPQSASPIDMAVLLDRSGKVRPFDAESNRYADAPPPSADLLTLLQRLPAQWVGLPFNDPKFAPQEGAKVGILQTPNGPMLIAEQSWPDASGSETLRLITGQALNPEAIQHLSEQVHLSVNMAPVTSPEVPDALRQDSPRTVRIMREARADEVSNIPLPPVAEKERATTRFIYGFVLLRDVYGKPVGVLEGITPNPFYNQGVKGVRVLLAFIWAAGLTFGIALNLLIDRWVLSRVSSLSGQLREVKGDYRDSSRVILPGKDELSTLADDVNAMLRRLVDWKQLEEKNREVSALNAELQRLNELKDEFLANTSHELRTPLNGMVGISESMLDGATGPLSEEQRYNLTLLTQSGKRLTNLVNDILDFSKLRHHELDLNRKPVSLRAMVEMVLQLDQSLIGAKPLTVINDIPKGLPLAHADENRLQQVLHNLIGNAIKFTHTGTVTISARVVGDGDKGVPRGAETPYVAVSISDTGIGIPEDKWERVFESFEQVEGSARREYGGTGLGLAITRNLLELHSGQIWVESRLGEGSVFTFTLPVSLLEDGLPVVTPPDAPLTPQWQPVQTEIAAIAADAVQERTPDTLAPHILIVDDEPVNLQVVKNFLSFEKYNITLASDGQEALTLLDQGLKPDIILLDVMMPRMTGYEVIQVIRQKAQANRLPIILLSARNQPEDIVLGLEVGANDYLTKPIGKEELVARIKTHLQIRRLEEETIRITIAYERQLAQFLDALPVGVSVHNPDTSLFYLNQMAKKLLQEEMPKNGEGAPLAIDYPIYQAGTQNLYPPQNLPFVRALEGEYSQADDLEVHLQDAVVPLEVLGTPIRDEQGQVVYAISAFQDITERKRAEQMTAKLLEANLSRQRLESELAIAAHIQRSMVPEIKVADEPHQRYDLDGFFQPARRVGGDLYDFFPLGDDRLCIVIGDVADKGVPAALLMARTVTLIRMLAKQTSTPDEILWEANHELCANNPECQFVTLFCGILDLETGHLRYASAGHDAPLLVRDRSVRLLDLETGPPIGLNEDASFPEYECRLQPDDMVVLYTDGITEARNTAGDLFTEERLTNALTEHAPANPAQAIEAIRNLHSQFVEEAPQSDDIALLTLQYRPAASCPNAVAPQPGEWTMAIDSELTELEKVKDCLEDFLKERRLTRESIDDAQLIAEEVLVNIIQYGYANEPSHRIDLGVTLSPECLRMTFEDRGTPFDPLTEIPPPDLSMDDAERSSGGLGFHLVRALSNHIDYTHEDGKNILVVSQSLADRN